MGSFSWLKADELTEVANVVSGKSFKFLIPKEFGGGFIKDKYQDYGYLGTKKDGTPKYDMYELLAFWNCKDKEKLKYDEDFPLMKEIDEYTVYNRSIGINLGCYNGEINKLMFPLKLVSDSYKGNYEDLNNRSYNDPNQGFYTLTRKKL